jgi:SAM-dependent methyltransferase
MILSVEKLVCEVCHSLDVVPVLDLGNHPLCDDLLKIGSKDQCEEFKIEIALCNSCLTAHQLHPVPKRKLFPSSYHYRSSMTQDVLNGMQGLVLRTKEKYGGLAGKKVVDVGCNDGSLLKFFESEGCKVFGIEPTGAAQDAIKNGIRVLNVFFDSKSAAQIVEEFGHPDFITFTNVFAHIEDMGGLIQAVQILMGKNTHLIIENHYLGAVLNRFQFDTFYHEHPRTYSAHSFLEIAKRLGRNIEAVEFPSRYGGNIRVFIGSQPLCVQEEANLKNCLEREQNFLLKFEQMKLVIDEWLENREELLSKVRSVDGKIYCKAFPGRAAILIKLLGLSELEIEAVFEKPESMKVGNYLPGTNIPILSEEEMMSLAPPPRKILNLAWHISEEIGSYVKKIDMGYECVDIFSADFKAN